MFDSRAGAIRVYNPDGQPYHPPTPPSKLSGRNTLSEFFRSFFRPIWLAKGSSNTKLRYEHSVGYWTGFFAERGLPEPPLCEIDDATGVLFVQWLQAQTFHRETIAPDTVDLHCRNLRRILKTAGPKLPHRRERLNQKLIDEVPWIEFQKPLSDGPASDYTLEEVQAMLAACEAMRTPREFQGRPIQNLAPADWWRAFIFVSCETAFRVGTMLRLEFAFLDADGWIGVPPKSAGKVKKNLTHFLRPHVLEKVEAIRGPRERIFPWYHYPESEGSRSFFYNQFTRLLDEAGISRERRFGTHGYRKYHATQLVGSDSATGVDDAARSLHHSGTELIARHYANRGVMGEAERQQLRASVERLPILAPSARERRGGEDDETKTRPAESG
jgi:integrase